MTNHHTNLLVIGLAFGAFWLFSSQASAGHTVACWEQPNPSDECVENAKEECEKAGGQWAGIEQGRGRIPGCKLNTSDSGKACDAPEQCEGACIWNKCSKYKRDHKDAKGCGIIVRDENGKIQTMCID